MRRVHAPGVYWTTIMALKYIGAATIVIGATWLPGIDRLPVWILLAAGCAALMGATLILERPRRGVSGSSGVWRRRRALIVGAGPTGQALAHSLEADDQYQVVGFVADPGEEAAPGLLPVLGRREAAPLLIHEHDIDEVILAHPPTWQQRLVEDLSTRYPDVRVRVVPTAYEALARVGKVENLGDIALLRFQPPPGAGREVGKRALDLILASAALIILSPLMLVLGALIRLTSAGPALFAQERVGRFGRPFVLYKFRTMVQDAEARTGPVLSSGRHDERLTRLGGWLKLFRLDELPQFWNVIRGDMSLVGPRPERPCFVAEFERTIPGYAKRHQVRPGITGLAQVCGGYHTHARDKLRFDTLYVTNRSFWLDLSILLRTLLVILTGRH